MARAAGGGGGQRRKAVARAAAFAAAISIVTGGVLYGRTEIARLVPGAAGLYAALGYPVNLRGLEFRDVTVETAIEEGLLVLSVSGNVVNLTGKPLAVPPIRYSMRDAARVEIYRWIGEAAARELAPAASAVFATHLASPPIAGAHIEIRFVDGDGRAADGGLQRLEPL
jgi:hypothetical protein